MPLRWSGFPLVDPLSITIRLLSGANASNLESTMHHTQSPSNRIFTRRKSLSLIAAERPSLDQDEQA